MRVIHSIDIPDEASIGAARRGVHAFATGIGFDQRARAEIDIVVQEIATNAVRYAGAPGDSCALHWTTPGVVTRDERSTPNARATPFHSTSSAESCSPSQERCGIELLYTDKGPGIRDLDGALRDHVSSGGSLGGGFGAIRRLSDEFYIHSTIRRAEHPARGVARRSTHGTAILCRKWLGSKQTNTDDASGNSPVLSFGAWSRPRPGETLNGDAYYIRHDDERTLLAVIDGLGHGAGAHAAAEVALDALAAWTDEPLDELMNAAHNALRATRGAVMGVALIDRGASKFHFAGVGNTGVRVFNAHAPTHPISANGTLGARLVKVPVWTYPWTHGTVIIMSSDGLSTSWDANTYPGLLEQSAQLVAGVLMRDFSRDSDDATVLVAR